MIRTNIGTISGTAIQNSVEHVSGDWRTALPVICAHGVTLRDLRLSDAASLHALLTAAEVSRLVGVRDSLLLPDGADRLRAANTPEAVMRLPVRETAH